MRPRSVLNRAGGPTPKLCGLELVARAGAGTAQASIRSRGLAGSVRRTSEAGAQGRPPPPPSTVPVVWARRDSTGWEASPNGSVRKPIWIPCSHPPKLCGIKLGAWFGGHPIRWCSRGERAGERGLGGLRRARSGEL